MNQSIQTLLYTIASLSASFVAILGGFVASKLLAINSERESIKNKLSEVKCNIILKKAQKGVLLDQLNMDDALNFIEFHINDLVNKSDLKEVYSETEKELLTYEILLPYWKKGLELVARIQNLDARNIEFNEDYVPAEIAADIKEKHFDYKVSAVIAKEIFPNPFCSVNLVANGVDDWYTYTNRKFQDLEQEIYALTVQESLMERQQRDLTKPKGMTSGLIIFILFSGLNIICPLGLSTINFSDVCAGWVALIAIGVLALGLMAVFMYLFNLLKWKQDETEQDAIYNKNDIVSAQENKEGL